MKSKVIIISIFLLILFFNISTARAESTENDSLLVLQLENDWAGGTDRYYTNGAKMIWVSKDMEEFGGLGALPGRVASFLGGLPLMNLAGRQHNVGLSLGQDMYTPYDKTKSFMVDGDRPYAGWSYFSLALIAKDSHCLDVVEATIGVIGPSSKAEQVQKEVHSWGLGAEPNGWEHQLGDEPGLMITWQRKWRTGEKRLESGLGFDFIPHVGLTGGNVATYANFGCLARFGFNLPRDFGRGIIRPGELPVRASAADNEGPEKAAPFRAYFLAGLDARAIARNIFLDGNTFRDSKSVARYVMVSDFYTGLAINFKRITLLHTYAFRTKEFIEQEKPQIYGSMALMVSF